MIERVPLFMWTGLPLNAQGENVCQVKDDLAWICGYGEKFKEFEGTKCYTVFKADSELCLRIECSHLPQLCASSQSSSVVF